MATAVQRLSQVMEVLSDHPGGASAAEVATSISLSRSAAAALLDSMVDVGLAERDEGKRYLLTARIYNWATRAVQRFLPSTAVREEMGVLAEQVRHPIIYAIKDGAWAISVERTDWREERSITVPQIGRRYWASSASGLVLVAFGPSLEIDALVSHASQPDDGVDPTFKQEDLQEEIRQIQHRGYAESKQTPGHGIAAPLIDSTGKCIAALGVVTRDLPESEERAKMLALVLEAATRCSISLGYRQPSTVP